MIKSRLEPQEPQNVPKIIIIGAGSSGICAAIKVKTELLLDSYEIYELNEEVGGAWFNNKYPGCSCDIPIHVYSYSFERKPDWTAQYAPQVEILQYLQSIAQKHGIYEHIKFRHQVKRLDWDDVLKKWTAKIHDLASQEDIEKKFDIVIHATGFLRNPKIPEQFLTFQGPILHTALWDNTINLEGKTVALVGAGSSAVQVTPHLSALSEKLVVYLRNPSWILPKLNFSFGPVSKWLFKNIPGLGAGYTWTIYHVLEGIYHGMKKDSWVSKKLTGLGNAYRKTQLKGRPDLIEKLTPKHPFGYRRTCLGSDYYSTFKKETTDLITSKIQKVTHDSIITEEGEIKIDVLVLATGFRVTDYFSLLEVYDRNGNNVLEQWKSSSPSLFLGITANELPNYFILYGPNTSTGHNSVILTVEYQINWIIKCLREMTRRNAKSVSVSKSTVDSYMQNINETMKTTVWSNSIKTDSSSWYLDDKGAVIAIYPGNLESFRKIARDFDVGDLEFETMSSTPR